jgi:hypothetical protein
MIFSGDSTGSPPDGFLFSFPARFKIITVLEILTDAEMMQKIS